MAGEQCFACLLRLGVDCTQNDTRSAGVTEDPDSHFLQAGVLPRFDDYVLHEEISRGGMGVVFRAEQISLKRPVAVKMILGGQLATQESVQRFRAEAEAAAQLDHPGIVPIYEVGVFETQHFFSMKLIEGTNLAERLNDFALSFENSSDAREKQVRIATLISRVARALAFAHERGVLHRDVKPTNILVDRNDHPYLTDFGLAKLTGNEAGGLTLSTAVLGSPNYMAPEQARGTPESVTVAADVYGVGAVLYELLTSRPPFTGPTVLETMRQVTEEPPMRPSRVNPRVHLDLETIALKCLEKDPAQRYNTAAAVADELDRFANGKPILARPVSRLESLRRWCRRNPALAGLTSLVMIAFLAGFLGIVWQWRRAESANNDLEIAVDRLQAEHTDQLLRDGDSPQALSRMAAQIRQNEHDWRSAMLGMSLMDQRVFAVPAMPPLTEHTHGGFTQARLSPDGTLVATLAGDRVIRLYRTADGMVDSDPILSETGFTAFEFSPSGEMIATAATDHSVQLWRVSDRSPASDPIVLDEPIRSIGFSADGRRWFAAAGSTAVTLETTVRHESVTIQHDGQIVVTKLSRDGTRLMTVGAGKIRIWSTASGDSMASLDVTGVRYADLAADGSRLVATNGGRVCSIWNTDTGEQTAKITSREGGIFGVQFNHQGKVLATVAHNHRAQFWDATSGLPLGLGMEHDYLIEDAKFSDDDKIFLTAALDGTVRVWDGLTGQPRCAPILHRQGVRFAQLGQSGGRTTLLSVVAPSAKVRAPYSGAHVWMLREPAPRQYRSMGYDENNLNAVVMSPSGDYIASATTRAELWFLKTATGEVVSGPISVRGQLWGLLFSPQGDRFYWTTSSGFVGMSSVPDGRELLEPLPLPATIQPSAISRDGRYIALGMTNHRVQIRSGNDCTLIAEYSHEDELNSLCFSPDGQWILSGSADGTALVYEVVSGRRISQLTGHGDEVMSVAFHPDGRRAVTGSKDFTARVWDVIAGTEVMQPLKHRGEVLQVDYSPDGRVLATGSRDRTVGLWDADSGDPLHPRLLQEDAIRNVRFSPDGKRLLALTFSGPRLWDVSTGYPLSVPLVHRVQGGTGFQCASMMPAFAPDGQSFIVGADSPQAILWPASVPPNDVPQWFPDLLEAVAGQRIVAGTSNPELVPAAEYFETRDAILKSSDTDAYMRWAKDWLTFSTSAPKDATGGLAPQ